MQVNTGRLAYFIRVGTRTRLVEYDMDFFDEDENATLGQLDYDHVSNLRAYIGAQYVMVF